MSDPTGNALRASGWSPIGQLEREDVERRTLEKAACIIEKLTGNPTYTQAWRLAARAVRCAKP